MRGFPALARLRAGGFAIWPIDVRTTPPVAVEIYPRVLSGAVVKRDLVARRAHLQARHPGLAPHHRDAAVGSEDAFDAAVSALVMSRHETELRSLPRCDDPEVRREGWVWEPDVSRRLRPGAQPAATG